jgi:hypothetical protein
MEVFVKIALANGNTLENRFATCEAAWQWQKETSHKLANKRAKADRIGTRWAFYAGSTCRGNTYGGWLVGSQTTPGAENLEWTKDVEKRLASQRPNWIG